MPVARRPAPVRAARCSRARRPGSRGRRSCASARATGARSPASTRQGRALRRRRRRAAARRSGHRAQPAQGRVGGGERARVLELQEESAASTRSSGRSSTGSRGRTVAHARRAPRRDGRVDGDEQGAEAARLPLRRADHLLRVHAGGGWSTTTSSGASGSAAIRAEREGVGGRGPGVSRSSTVRPAVRVARSLSHGVAARSPVTRTVRARLPSTRTSTDPWPASTRWASAATYARIRSPRVARRRCMRSGLRRAS